MPPRSRASACSGPRPTGTGRCSCPWRRARPPPLPRQLDAQYLGDVDLDDDLALEVAPRIEVEVLVRGTSKAILASMGTTSVRVDRPAERHPRLLRHLVQRALRADLVEAHVQRLGHVEAADHRLVAVAGQPSLLLGLDRQVAPAHERMFARAADGRKRSGQASARATSDISPVSVCDVAPVISTGT